MYIYIYDMTNIFMHFWQFNVIDNYVGISKLNCKVCRLVIALHNLIVTICKRSLNSITNPTPCLGTNTWHWLLLPTILNIALIRTLCYFDVYNKFILFKIIEQKVSGMDRRNILPWSHIAYTIRELIQNVLTVSQFTFLNMAFDFFNSFHLMN